jgi:hypothetical protein
MLLSAGMYYSQNFGLGATEVHVGNIQDELPVLTPDLSAAALTQARNLAGKNGCSSEFAETVANAATNDMVMHITNNLKYRVTSWQNRNSDAAFFFCGRPHIWKINEAHVAARVHGWFHRLLDSPPGYDCRENVA